MSAVNYLWDPVEDNVVREFGDAGATLADYTTEPELYGNLVSQQRDEQSGYFHFDGVGSTIAVTDNDQQTIAMHEYTAFGEAVLPTDNTHAPYEYVGKKGYYRETPGHYSVRQ